ncbi:MAG: hypothetical protein QM535_20805 [Limnohabitans sp.]|nr:hypothetical protein [Limnohabitans sp.]
MADTKFIMFFRSEINQSLLIDTNERIGIQKIIPDLKLSNIEGVNYFGEWEKIFEEVMRLWQVDIDKGFPFFKMESTILDKLACFFDLTAKFFLFNGSAVDNDYLKNVDDFFKEHNIQRGQKSSTELFHKAFKI